MIHKITYKEITKKNIEFHNLIASVYDSSQEQNHPKVISLYKNIFDKILNYFYRKKINKINILDFGCGTGFLEQFLNPKLNNITGFDVSEKLLEIAKKKHPDVQYYLTDAYKLPTKKKYDLIVENAVLHHLKNYQEIINKITPLLKPGGCLFLGAEPNYYCYRYLSLFKQIFRTKFKDNRKIRNKKRQLEKYVEYHMYFANGFNPFEMKKKLLSHNFAKVDIYFSSREFFAGLIDRFNFHLINYLPNFLLDSTGVFSRIFYLVAYKR